LSIVPKRYSRLATPVAAIVTTLIGAAVAFAMLVRWPDVTMSHLEPVAAWTLVGCFWLLAVLQFSPWQWAEGAARPVEVAFSIVCLMALFFVVLLSPAIGMDALWVAVVPGVLASLVRILLVLNGIWLWKPDEDEQA
jgi:hypothetical protein